MENNACNDVAIVDHCTIDNDKIGYWDAHVVLLGGGVDSSAILSLVAAAQDPKKIRIVHIDYGQKARKSEWDICNKQADYYNIPKHNVSQIRMDMSYATCGIMPDSTLDTGVAKNNVLELRNPLIMTFVASYLATTNPGMKFQVYVGFHKEPLDTAFKDAVATRYLSTLNRVIKMSISNQNTDIILRAPFKHRTRERILKRLVVARGMNFVKDYVHTCYEEVACGTCTHCKWLNTQLSFLEDSENV